MPRVIAVAGKGGVGKTTLCSMLVRFLVEQANDGPVLAVDADPNSNLNELLGLTVGTTIGEARELMKKDVPTNMTKDTWFNYKLNEAVIESQKFDLLVMGRPEGQGCYCAANTLAKQAIDTLKQNYSFVVIDNEAGMEHMSRLVTQDVDCLFIVSDGTPRGIVTASRIVGLIKELQLRIAATCLVINRVTADNEHALREIAAEKRLENVRTIREDEYLLKADREGKSVFEYDSDLPALYDAYRIFGEVIPGFIDKTK
ncbi:MAG TPA: AAA family ATPase [Syntrophorhabdaceae bacterium]|nr:AAA family ATPase [Syntrophorhabdaceae bacterium]